MTSEVETDWPSAEALTTAPDDEEQVRQEIGAISRKIAENERLLRGLKGSCLEAEEAQVPPDQEDVATASQTHEDGCGYYVYGIVGSNGSQPVESLPEQGIDPAYPVYALPYQAIQAIVSTVSLEEFGQEQIEANLEDLKWVYAEGCWRSSY